MAKLRSPFFYSLFILVFSFIGFETLAQNLKDAVVQCGRSHQGIPAVRDLLRDATNKEGGVLQDEIDGALSTPELKAAFQACVTNERNRSGNNNQGTFIRDAKRDCTDAQKRLNEAQRDRTKYCSAITDPSATTSRSAGLNYGQCLARTDNCSKASREPMDIFSGGDGDAPSLVVDPNCQFLMVGSCKEYDDRSREEGKTARELEKDARKVQEEMVEAQKNMQKSRQDLQERISETTQKIQNLPLMAKRRDEDLQREVFRALNEVREKVREAQANINKTMTSLQEVDREAKAEIDGINLGCFAIQRQAQEEAETTAQNLRKNRQTVKNFKDQQQLSARLMKSAQNKFKECMNGPERALKIRQVVDKRASRLNQLKRDLAMLNDVVKELQTTRVDELMRQSNFDREYANKMAEQEFEQSKSMLEQLQQNTTQQAYMDQAELQQLAAKSQAIQTQLGQAGQRQAMYRQGANLARNAGDDCTDKTKSGRENMTEAIGASFNYQSSMEETWGACCQKPEEFFGSGNLTNPGNLGTEEGAAIGMKAFCTGLGRNRSRFQDAMIEATQ